MELGSLAHTQFDDADAFVYGEEEPYDAGYDSHEGKVTLARHNAADDATGWDFFQLVLVKLLDNAVVTVIMAIATFFALFGDDFRLAALPKEADAAFTVCSSPPVALPLSHSHTFTHCPQCAGLVDDHADLVCAGAGP